MAVGLGYRHSTRRLGATVITSAGPFIFEKLQKSKERKS
jgi:hypothetical protein